MHGAAGRQWEAIALSVGGLCDAAVSFCDAAVSCGRAGHWAMQWRGGLRRRAVCAGRQAGGQTHSQLLLPPGRRLHMHRQQSIQLSRCRGLFCSPPWRCSWPDSPQQAAPTVPPSPPTFGQRSPWLQPRCHAAKRKQQLQADQCCNPASLKRHLGHWEPAAGGQQGGVKVQMVLQRHGSGSRGGGIQGNGRRVSSWSRHDHTQYAKQRSQAVGERLDTTRDKYRVWSTHSRSHAGWSHCDAAVWICNAGKCP